jgi:uncharacterized protein DUF1275
VVLAKTFTGHVTGGLVLAAIAMAAHEWRALLAHLAAVVFFLTGVLFGVRIEQTHAASPSRQPLFTVVGIEVILTTTACLALASRAAMGAEIFVACVSLALRSAKRSISAHRRHQRSHDLSHRNDYQSDHHRSGIIASADETGRESKHSLRNMAYLFSGCRHRGHFSPSVQRKPASLAQPSS